MLLKSVGSLLLLCALTVRAASWPDPYAPVTRPTIGPAPTPTMEQVFWLQLPGQADAATTVELPAGVTRVDRTPPGRRGPFRIYLRAERPLRDATLRVTSPDGCVDSVALTVRSYREDLEVHLREVPGIDPAVRKRGRSYYTPQMIALGEANLRRHPELKRQLERPTPYSDLGDEELFARLPSWSQPRNFYGNFPCPFCGPTILRHSGFYPWKFDDAHPFKAQCPDCGRWFPSNDLLRGDLTSGDFPDDGWGWDPGSGDRRQFAAWVAHFTHQRLWLRLGDHLRQLSLQYLCLKDKAAAHRVAVLLARMAYVYPGMNMRWQLVDDTYSRPGRLLGDGNWERKNTLVPACQAYDAIFDAIDGDAALIAFLQRKDPQIRTGADVKALIETAFIQVLGWDWIRREATGGNMGARELDLVRMAVAADLGSMSDRWIEEVFTRGYNSGLNQGGYDDQVLTNLRTREGPTWIAGPLYAANYTRAVGEMADALSRLRPDSRWYGRVNLYDRTRFPKFHSELETWTRFSVAGQYIPSWGDGIGPPGLRYSSGILQDEVLRPTLVRAYRQWPEDWLARALVRIGPGKPELFQEENWTEITAHAQRVGPAPALPSRVFDGFGWVLLESRPDAADPNHRAGVALRYGFARGHEHQDNLDMQFFARGLNLAPDLGYPTWAAPLGSTGHVAHHNTGMVDRSPQYRGRPVVAASTTGGNSLAETFASAPTARGTLEAFASAPEASFAEVSARPTGFPNRVYRRAIVLADAPGRDAYLFDVFRIAGGRIRTYGLHGPPSDAFTASVPFAPTGEAHFEVGPLPPNDRMQPNILRPRRADTAAAIWADWRFMNEPRQEWKGASALGAPLSWPVRTGETHLRVHLLGATGRRYFTAEYGRVEVPATTFLYAEDEAAEGASEFVAIWEPYGAERFITRVERIPIAGGPGGTEFTPVAVRVWLKGGQVDTLIYAGEPGSPLRLEDGTEFDGRFGYWSEMGGRLRAVHLVDGRRFARGSEGIAAAPAPFRSSIERVDYANRLLWLREPLDAGDVVGRMLYIDNGVRTAAYEIEAVLEDRRVVRVRHSPLLFRARAMNFAADAPVLRVETEPPIERVTGFPAGYYDGATVTGDDGRTCFRLARVEGAALHLDRVPRRGDFPEEQPGGRRMVRIYEFGPGDRVSLPISVFRVFEPPLPSHAPASTP